MPARPSLFTVLLFVFACVAGAAAVLIAGRGFSLVPRPQETKTAEGPVRQLGGGEPAIDTGDHILSKPLLVTEAHWQPLPRLFADFDLQLDVELSPETELDIMVRRVEPRPLNGERLQFHGRFTVLRLSTGKAPSDEGWRSREQALFDRGGGVQLAAGRPATVWVHGRGRTLTGNVAGIKLGSFESADAHGSFAFLVRGGKAEVKGFHLKNLGEPSGLPAWLLGAGIGLLLCGLGKLFGVRDWSLLITLTLLAAGAELGRTLVLGNLLPLQVPTMMGVLLAAFCCAPIVLVDWLPGKEPRRHPLAMGLCIATALVAVLVLLELGARTEDPRRRQSEHPALDLVFGPVAGETVAEALAGRVRGPRAIHVPDASRPAVMLLGGHLLWAPGDPDESAELKLEENLKGRGLKAEVMALPTADGYSQQQWLLYDLFFRRQKPAVLVFGVPTQDDVEEPGGSAVTRLQQFADWRDHRLVLRSCEPPRGLLFRGSPPPRGHRMARRELKALLQRVRSECDAASTRLVFAAGPGLPVALLDELRDAAEQGHLMFELSAGEPPAAMAERLGHLVAQLLPK